MTYIWRVLLRSRSTVTPFEGPDMRADPAGQLLAPGSFGKGVTAESHGGHEDRRPVDLAGVAVVNRNRGAGIIDKQLFAGLCCCRSVNF